MRERCRYAGAQRTLDGRLLISFEVDDSAIPELEALKDKELVMELKKYSEKRSLNANAYFWKLCDSIAQVLGSTKDEIYLIQLSRYGFWLDKEVLVYAIPDIKQMFRLVEEFDDVRMNATGDMVQTIRCYIGSSHYSKSEMARLIDGTVQDAKDIGVETWTQEELERLVAMWNPS